MQERKEVVYSRKKRRGQHLDDVPVCHVCDLHNYMCHGFLGDLEYAVIWVIWSKEVYLCAMFVVSTNTCARDVAMLASVSL